MKPNSWRTMWVVAMFDLPVQTKAARQRYARFRKLLLENGFGQLQYSVYIRHCSSFARAQALVERIGPCAPKDGHVLFFFLTDKQYGMTREFFGPKTAHLRPKIPAQIELF
ncbi:MAG: CRISPR-associated endonuclease Cas2 [Zetaproteobacteria bacterium]|nr:MAG: CRISPR-associated endonuclease Cas2 [Zetaproteobacteria bacterium]